MLRCFHMCTISILAYLLVIWKNSEPFNWDLKYIQYERLPGSDIGRGSIQHMNIPGSQLAPAVGWNFIERNILIPYVTVHTLWEVANCFWNPSTTRIICVINKFEFNGFHNLYISKNRRINNIDIFFQRIMSYSER